jgi:AGZA family xanthine/uracil permease-like MFS transporter
MAAFLIDRRYLAAAGYAAAAAVLSFLGFIHAGAIGWAAAPHIALGYTLLAATFAAFGWGRRYAETAEDADSTRAVDES